ncbi:MAG: type IX secretion system membrane protein PorP/SprF [Bacteroidetes bacterium]|nr:type IX secretion system membrane protein PorP/SprF [Bacteroidota bacterium]
MHRSCGYSTRIFKFGYSYDITVSKLANASAGSHELSLGLQCLSSQKETF